MASVVFPKAVAVSALNKQITTTYQEKPNKRPVIKKRAHRVATYEGAIRRIIKRVAPDARIKASFLERLDGYVEVLLSRLTSALIVAHAGEAKKTRVKVTQEEVEEALGLLLSKSGNLHAILKGGDRALEAYEHTKMESAEAQDIQLLADNGIYCFADGKYYAKSNAIVLQGAIDISKFI